MRLQLAILSLRRHTSRTLLATLGVAVSAAMLLDMVMLAGGMALGVGLSTMNPVRDNVLDVSDVERDVAEILLDPIDGYGVDGLTSVRCNGGKDPVVRAGA